MPAAKYTYTIDQCDVTEERRSALKRFREKREEWLSWLHIASRSQFRGELARFRTPSRDGHQFESPPLHHVTT